jgi:two-component system, NarL family, sensor kinase
LENGTQTDIILLVIAGCLGMLILVVSIILFVVYYQKKVLSQKNDFQKQLLSATVQVEEKERERIAKNIHDDIGTLLSVLKLNMSRAARNTDDKELVKRIAAENYKLLDESIQAVRGAIKDLAPPTLNKLGYLKAIGELCRQINGTDNINIALITDSMALQLPQKDELQLYRLSKELLNNIIKHSNASQILVEFEEKNKMYKLRLSHNGKGISDEQVRELSKEQKGLGLKSIESRAQLIDAAVHYNMGNIDKRPFIEVNIPYGPNH